MKKIFLILMALMLISACSTPERTVEIKRVEYDGNCYDYQDLNYFLEKHGYIGEGSHLDKGSYLNIKASTHSFRLDSERNIEVIFMGKVEYDLETMPVKDETDCDMRCDDSYCVCDLSNQYISVDNMLFKSEDKDIAEYVASEGMREYQEDAKYNIVSVDDFLKLLDDNSIVYESNNIESTLDAGINYNNVETERIDMAACIELSTEGGSFRLYQLFIDPFEKYSAYALEYGRFLFNGDDLIPYSNIGIAIDNLILEVIKSDDRIVDIFRRANW